MTIRVALADDDALVRSGIARLLEHHDDIDVVISADDGRDLVRQAMARPPDVILLDIRMPGLDGVETLGELRRSGVDAPAAMVTTFRQEALVERAIDAGAMGFLLKSDGPEDLIRNVRALHDGGAVFSPRIAAWLIGSGRMEDVRVRRDASARIAGLSPRHRDVLAHLATGASNAEIARATFLSEGTVKQYLRTIFEELGVDNRVRAALVGYQAGLVAGEWR